jgi:hypothetical protein
VRKLRLTKMRDRFRQCVGGRRKRDGGEKWSRKRWKGNELKFGVIYVFNIIYVGTLLFIIYFLV